MQLPTILALFTLLLTVLCGQIPQKRQLSTTTSIKLSTTKSTTAIKSTTTKTSKLSTTKTTSKIVTTATTIPTTASISKTTKATQTGKTKTLPASSGFTALPTALVVTGTFDGGMLRWERDPPVCQGQSETDEPAAMFILEDGARIENVIIGATQAEGIHCRGACTISNVWWSDVCEDAATFKQPRGDQISYVIGGGAFNAADKVFQFNGRGTLSISNFYAQDYGKVSRSCGDCTANGGPRHIIVDNVTAFNGGALCGVNVNFGDTCRITNSCQSQGRDCDRFTGVVKGNGSSVKLGRGHDGVACFVDGFSGSC